MLLTAMQPTGLNSAGAQARDAGHPHDEPLVLGSGFGAAPWMVRGAAGPEGFGMDLAAGLARRPRHPSVEVVDFNFSNLFAKRIEFTVNPLNITAERAERMPARRWLLVSLSQVEAGSIPGLAAAMTASHPVPASSRSPPPRQHPTQPGRCRIRLAPHQLPQYRDALIRDAGHRAGQGHRGYWVRRLVEHHRRNAPQAHRMLLVIYGVTAGADGGQVGA